MYSIVEESVTAIGDLKNVIILPTLLNHLGCALALARLPCVGHRFHKF